MTQGWSRRVSTRSTTTGAGTPSRCASTIAWYPSGAALSAAARLSSTIRQIQWLSFLLTPGERIARATERGPLAVSTCGFAAMFTPPYGARTPPTHTGSARNGGSGAPHMPTCSARGTPNRDPNAHAVPLRTSPA